MKLSTNKLLLACLTASTITTASLAIDLGTINVESSTIDVNTDTKTESSSVSFIKEDTIKKVGTQNLYDMLKTIPGMTNVSRTGEMMQFRFRGVNNQTFMGEKPGVAIIIDGVPVKSISGGVRLNLEDIKNIKVVKGSASYMYGEDALSGAIIITTKKENTKNESSFLTEVGSYGHKKLELSTTQGFENFNINLNGTYKKIDGYWVDSGNWTKSINGKFTYYIDDSSDITFGADLTKKFSESTRGVVNGEKEAKNNPKGKSDNAFVKDSGVDLNKYFLTYTKSFDNSDFKITGYKYEDLYNQIFNPEDTDNNPATPKKYGQESDKNLVQEGIKAEYTIESNKLATLIGLEFGQQKYSDKDKILMDFRDDKYNRRYKKRDLFKGERDYITSDEETKALYTELKFNVTKKLTTTINARYNKQAKNYKKDTYKKSNNTWQSTIEDNSKSFTDLAYRLGVNYHFSKLMNLYANVATGFQTPDVPTIVDNPDIKNETTTTYEIGSRGTTKWNSSYDLTLFQIDNKDIISYKDGTYMRSSGMANVGNSRHRGLELSYKSNNEKRFSYSLAYTYLDARYTSHLPYKHELTTRNRGRATVSQPYDIEGNKIPRVSDHTLDLFLNYKINSNFKFTTELYARSDYWADEMNTLKIDGYETINMQLAYDSKINKNKLEVYFKIDNVFDKQYYRTAFFASERRGELDVVDREDLSITVDPGRVYYAGLKYIF